MAWIAEQRLHGRYNIDVVAVTLAILLGLSALLILYQAYAGASLMNMVVGIILLLAALATGWRACRYRRNAPEEMAGLPPLLEARVENLVAQRTAQARELIAYMEACREQEKKALARKLHGDLGSSLTAMSLHLAMLSRQLPDTPAVQHRIKEIKALLASAADVSRQIQAGLRPEKLELFGLKAAIEELADSVSQSSGIAVALQLPPQEMSFSSSLEIALYRMLELVLGNVAQHAYATRVDIVMEETAGRVTLQVIDNGVGFDLRETQAGAYGLHSLRERARYLGGQAEIQAAPGKGTKVSISLPLARQPDALQRRA